MYVCLHIFIYHVVYIMRTISKNRETSPKVQIMLCRQMKLNCSMQVGSEYLFICKLDYIRVGRKESCVEEVIK